MSRETRALLESAREGDRLDGERREALRQSVATVLGVAGQGALGSAPRSWGLRALGALAGSSAALVLVAGLQGVRRPQPVGSAVPGEASRVSAIAMRVEASGDTPSVATGDAPSAAIEAGRHDAPEPPPTPATSPAKGRRDSGVPAHGVLRPVASAGDDLDLAAEARLLAAVEDALDVGHGERALELLDEHDHRFPSGILAPESAALRVGALCDVRRAAEARDQAARARARYPSAPVARSLARCDHTAE